ncbi:type II toxin-antitoxin system VapC family toxin [Ornithinicoccus hortensis]|uniref:Ribonuclease VapC n=1 Tax=Ornithinicoccus hortensis TaxID=82346 RepID=A0A542YUR4_9MICO|nr:type II toxin-antitoxin system VapC family toxin [Ornithinicoccus hortensis]TQL51825.1 ribonuclease VapC [Ornithinicoccus hortensis]
MILDTSAIVAILNNEDDAPEIAAALEGATVVRMSVATLLEASLVAGPERQSHLDELLDVVGAEIVPVDLEQLREARVAHLRFGRGAGSPARLNYGDCFSYALAKTSDEPSLFKGEDFPHTDVRSSREIP